jgi:hypothetical protein
MNSLTEQRQEEPAKWERIYLHGVNVLLAAVGALFTWNVFSTGDWRVRSGYIFIVVWMIALKVGTRLVPTQFITRVQNWRAGSRLHEFLFSLLRAGLPVSLFGYLVRWHSRWELVTIILITSLMPLFMWRPNQTVPPSIHD